MNTELISLREQITQIDNEILELLEKRMSLAEEIAEIKKEEGIDIEDKDWEKTIIERRKMYTSLDPEFVENFMKTIIKESKRIQQ